MEHLECLVIEEGCLCLRVFGIVLEVSSVSVIIMEINHHAAFLCLVFGTLCFVVLVLNSVNYIMMFCLGSSRRHTHSLSVSKGELYF